MLPILTRILSPKSARSKRGQRTPQWFANASLCLAAMSVMMAGCGGGSSTSGVKAGLISMTNANGLTATATALSIGSKLTLSMTPANDVANAGIDWTVTCAGNPVTGSFTNGACGTLTPAHTADGAGTVFTAPSTVPIGATVTITATVTSNPSQSSSASLTILSTPIAVSFAVTPPSSIQVNTPSNQFTALVTNDPAAAGVIWTATCGSAACGSFNPTVTTVEGTGTTYTAPSAVPNGGTVTITATSLTDTTKSVSATVTITAPLPPPPPPPPPAPIFIILLPANIYVEQTGAARSATLTAIVSNDTAAAGVDWTLSCSTSSCGTISSHTSSGAKATFQNSSTVPVGGTIIITAKSTTDPTKSATATVNVVTSPPIAVTLSTPLPATLNTGSQATLAATASSGIAGINWTATCGSAGACGSFSLSPAQTANGGPIVYTAPAVVPAGSVVTISASSAGTTPSNPALATTTIVQAPPPPLSLSFASAPPASLVSAAQLSVSVIVANDVAPGGVTWTTQCGNTAPGGCGWFAPAQTASGTTSIYTAPPVTSSGTSVTLIATSIGDPSVTLSSNPISITPDTTLAVHFIPSLPSQIQPDAAVNLNAAVANDPTNAGVNWQVCASGCGFFTIKPATPEIPATSTTPFVPSAPAVTATTVSGWPNGLPILYTAPSQVPTSGMVAVVATAHADGMTANSGTIAISPVSTGPALHGVVQVGTQPVVGASVALYAAGTAGYGSAATQVIMSPATDSGGNFTIPATYACPQPNSQMYLVASGGTTGSNAPNPNRVLMTALGSCANLSSGAVVVNEATTVAGAFATSPFAANDALTGNSSYLYLGTSSSNLVGLANAFAAVNNLVDISSGKVKFTVPAGNAALPYVEIDTLADIINACAATGGGVEGDGSTCSTLFTATDLLGTGTFNGSIAPSDTLQAAFNIAQHPASNFGYQLDNNDQTHLFFALATSASPFQPILAASPSDWSISLNYTSGGGLSSASTVGSFAVDGSGNLWITDTNAGSVVEWNATGAALSPATGFPAGGGPIAIDPSGNVWVSGNGALYELTNLGSPLPWSPFGGVSGGGTEAAFDAQSDLWITSSAGVSEFNNLGVQLSPVNGYTFAGSSNFTAVSIDSSNNVWAGTGITSDNPGGRILELSNPSAQPITNVGPGSSGSQMAADSQGDVWYVNFSGQGPGEVCEVLPFAGKGSTLPPNCTDGGGPSISGTTLNLTAPRGVGLDGAGVLWIASQGGNGNNNAVLSPGLFPIESSSTTVGQTLYTSSSLAAGPLRVAVDGSGNVWVLLANNTVTEYVGAATPVVAPLALGVQNKKLGAKP
jgi:hypothetical protein